MIFLRNVTGCSIIDKIRKEDIKKELKIMPISVKIKNYRAQWKEHFKRMNRNCVPNTTMKYKPKRTEESCRKDRLKPEQAYKLQP